MKIILSPTKQMVSDTDNFDNITTPVFLEKTKEILTWMRSKSNDDLKKLWNCNDIIAKQNFERINNMDLYSNLTPAIMAYDGIAFKYMAATVFDFQQLEYVQEHLCILSAFYGLLRPMDGIVPYRLEMQAKAAVNGSKNLYEYWGDSIYKRLDEQNVIINLASKEYSKIIEKYISKDIQYITISFVERVGDKLVTKATHAKMARGEMVRFMAENNITEINIDKIKAFDRLGYKFLDDISSDDDFIFEKIY